jgi:RNA recognition motif-containing protein
MGLKVYVCNINWSATEADFRNWLTEVQGYVVEKVELIMSGETGRSRGFAFVTFKTLDAASEALRDLEGEDFMGRPLHASTATAKPSSGERRGRPTRRPSENKPVMGSRYGVDDEIDWGDNK